MNENKVLNKINKLHKTQRAFMGLVDAKFVNIRKNRVCSYCGKVIVSGSRALTCSMPTDKKYGVTFQHAYVEDSLKNYKFVLVRQWLHDSCVDFAVNSAQRVKIKDVWYKRMSFDDIDLGKLDDEEALEVLNYFYSKGEVTPEEYKVMEDALIDSIAFRDAKGIGQE